MKTTRRVFLCSSAALSACGGSQDNARATLRRNVEAAFRESTGIVTCYVVTGGGEVLFSRHPSDVLKSASIDKLLIARAFFSRPKWRDNFAKRADYRCTCCSRKDARGSQTLGDAVERMLVDSDNCSADALIEFLGLTYINDLASALKLQSTRLHGYFSNDLSTPSRATTSAIDMASLLRSIIRDFHSSSEDASFAAGLMLNLLVRQTDKTVVAAGLPRDMLIANKTGEVHDVLNDVLILMPFSQTPIIACLLMNRVRSKRVAHAVARKVGYALFDFLFRSHLLR